MAAEDWLGFGSDDGGGSGGIRPPLVVAKV